MQRLKTKNKAEDEEDKKRQQRDLNVLCLNHLIISGFTETAERFSHESGISMDKYELCDNITLSSIFVDFEQFYELKYGIKPKFCNIIKKEEKKKPQPLTPAESRPSRIIAKTSSGKNVNIIQPDPSKKPMEHIEPHEPNEPRRDDSKQVKPPKEENVPADVRLMKPIPLKLRIEFGDLTSVIARDIFVDNPGVKWTDIVGLNDAKRVLREAVVMPLKYPQLFEGKKLLTPWKGVLLHGPPGTGKTLLAKAVAGEGTTFFNISASTLVSKWRGDSEKLIRIMFELARYHAPSTIFIDELDAIMSKRSSDDEHEASRRMKTEMLTQMDGLVQSDALVFVLAASNFPFDLDPALLRRLEKRILVPLPEIESRENMFRTFLTSDIADQNIDFNDFAKRTEKYSGSDIRLVCKEAAMEPLRKLMSNLQDKYGENYLDEQLDEEMHLDLITQEDLETALKRTSTSAVYDMSKYQEWQSKFGVV